MEFTGGRAVHTFGNLIGMTIPLAKKYFDWSIRKGCSARTGSTLGI